MVAFGSEVGERFEDNNRSRRALSCHDRRRKPTGVRFPDAEEAYGSTLNAEPTQRTKRNAQSLPKTGKYLTRVERREARTPSGGAFPRPRLRHGGRP